MQEPRSIILWAMTDDRTLTARAVEAIQTGLETAKRGGAASMQAPFLDPEQLDSLATATLTHLRSRPGKPYPIDGWRIVTTKAAGVLSWWAQHAGLSDADRRRLGPLRDEVYDVLAERHLIERLVAFFATGDSIVANNLVLNLYKHINAPLAKRIE